MECKNKTILITGAAGGIGSALVERFLKEGAVVYATDLNPVHVKQANEHPRCIAVACDVTQPVSIEAARQRAIQERGHIDIWINNAGIRGVGEFAAFSADDFNRVMDVNFNGTVNGTRAALSHMIEYGAGFIINIASVSGHVASALMSSYSASKHAVVGFTKCLIEEFRLTNSPLHMMLVSPGFVHTDMVKKGEAMGFPSWMSWALSTPESVAAAVVEGIRKEQTEIYPTLSGKAILTAHSLFPKITRRSSKVLLARTFKDFLLNRTT